MLTPSTARPVPPPHVLLVEDEPTIAVTLVDDLEEQGYRVTHTADGAAAIRLLTSRAFDAVITDLRLPGADGMQVLSAARHERPTTQVLLITAYADHRRESAAAGRPLTILEKPFCNSRVLAWLRTAV